MGKFLIAWKICPKCGQKRVRSPERCKKLYCYNKKCNAKFTYEEWNTTQRIGKKFLFPSCDKTKLPIE